MKAGRTNIRYRAWRRQRNKDIVAGIDLVKKNNEWLREVLRRGKAVPYSLVACLLLFCLTASAQNITPPPDTNTVTGYTVQQSPKAATSQIAGTQPMLVVTPPAPTILTLSWEVGIDTGLQCSTNLVDWQPLTRNQVRIVTTVTNYNPQLFFRAFNDWHDTNQTLVPFITITNQ